MGSSAAIEAVNLAKEVSSVTPAEAVFGTVSAILATIKVRFHPVHDFWLMYTEDQCVSLVSP